MICLVVGWSSVRACVCECVSMSLLPDVNKGLLCDNVGVLSPTQPPRHSGQSLTEGFFFSSFFSKVAIVTMQCVTEGRPCTRAFYCACESCSFSGSGPKHQTKQVGSQDLCSWFFVLSLTSLYKLFKWLFLFLLRAFTMFVINFLNAS